MRQGIKHAAFSHKVDILLQSVGREGNSFWNAQKPPTSRQNSLASLPGKLRPMFVPIESGCDTFTHLKIITFSQFIKKTGFPVMFS